MLTKTKRRGPALRFRLFGTPVRIGLTFPVAIVALPLLFGGELGRSPALLGTWLGLVTVSVLVHEAGHVAALRSFGYQPEVSLNALGGLTSTDDVGHLSPMRSIIVSLAGPAAGIMLGITVEAALIPIGGRTIFWLRTASWFVNIWWSLFNLLPIMPLDGGHVMRELVEITSRRRGAAIGGLITLVVALFALGWWGFGQDYGLWVVIVAGLMIVTNIRYFAFTEHQRKLQTITIAHEQLMNGDHHAGIATLLPYAFSHETHLIPDEAYTTLAWALLHEWRFHELCALDSERFHPNHRRLLDGATAWYRGDLPKALTMVSEALGAGSVDPPDTYFQRTFGRIGEVDRLAQRIGQLPHDDAARAGTRLRTGLVAAGALA